MIAAKRVFGCVILGLAMVLVPSVAVGQQAESDLEAREEKAFKEASKGSRKIFT